VALQQFDELRITPPQVIDPDRRIDENHERARRRGGAAMDRSVPPSAARRRALA
jgi:hypothetical protein